MGETKAVELRHDGKTYRAADREIFFRWAREHRISIDDSYRIAGTEKWIPVSANNELNNLLNPDNWWKVKMSGKTYVTFDWDSIVKWAREGRLSIDVQIEGPKTPPGGILGKASPELSPYLREWVQDDPDKKPLRVRFDDKIYIPGNMDTLKQWINESRVPVEAEVSIQGGDWQCISECGYFEAGLWPEEAPVEDQEEPRKSPEAAEPPRAEEESSEPPESAAHDSGKTAVVADKQGNESPSDDSSRFFSVTTTYGEEYVFEDPEEVLSLLKRKRVHSFDEIRHPDLPDGAMFISEFIKEYFPKKGIFVLLLILAIIFGLGGAAAIIFQQPEAQWMMVVGIASLVVALLLTIRLIWKK